MEFDEESAIRLAWYYLTESRYRYWYGFYWDDRHRTRSFYVGETLPVGVKLIIASDDAASSQPGQGGDAHT
jgi:hypothetical protein